MSMDPFGSPVAGGDEFELDMTALKPFEAIHVPAGWYKAEVVGLEKGYSSKGNPMWTWKFLITEGAYEGKVISLMTVLTPQAMWKAGEVVKAIGLGTEGTLAKFDRDQAIGRRCVISCQDDDYNGDLRSIVKRVKAHPEGPLLAAA